MSEAGISLDAMLPLDWQPEGEASATVLEQRRLGNISLLKALAAVDALASDGEDVPESVRKRLDRVESKLDVLLMLTARLVAEASNLPAEREISLSQYRISWKEPMATVPAIGQKVIIRLFLSPRIPQPLSLQAIVSNSLNGLIEAELSSLDEEFEEWLTRTIFRHHRRAVHARKQP